MSFVTEKYISVAVNNLNLQSNDMKRGKYEENLKWEKYNLQLWVAAASWHTCEAISNKILYKHWWQR